MSSVNAFNFNGSHTAIYISAYLQLSYSVYCTDIINQISSNGRTEIFNKTELCLIRLSHSMEEVVSEDLWPSNARGKK